MLAWEARVPCAILQNREWQERFKSDNGGPFFSVRCWFIHPPPPDPFPADAQLVLWAVLGPVTDFAAPCRKLPWPVLFSLLHREPILSSCVTGVWVLSLSSSEKAAASFLPELGLGNHALIGLVPLTGTFMKTLQQIATSFVVYAEPHCPCTLELVSPGPQAQTLMRKHWILRTWPLWGSVSFFLS